MELGYQQTWVRDQRSGSSWVIDALLKCHRATTQKGHARSRYIQVVVVSVGSVSVAVL